MFSVILDLGFRVQGLGLQGDIGFRVLFFYL